MSNWAGGVSPLCLQGESDVGVHDRVIVLTAHKLNIKADVEMRGRAQMAEGGSHRVSRFCEEEFSDQRGSNHLALQFK